MFFSLAVVMAAIVVLLHVLVLDLVIVVVFVFCLALALLLLLLSLSFDEYIDVVDLALLTLAMVLIISRPSWLCCCACCGQCLRW